MSINDFRILLGSQAILKNIEYKKSAIYNEFLEECETIYAMIDAGIAMKRNSLQICLHDISVSIHSMTIEEAYCEYNAETGNYTYSILNEISMEFEETELKEFLYNFKKRISITAKISLKLCEEPCGIILKKS